MADQRSVRILAAIDEHLVVAQVVADRRLLRRMAGQEMGDGLGAGILGFEIERDAGPVEGSQGLLEPQAHVLVLHERGNALP
ncbi:MAG: hypothetical protein OXK74_14250 [Gemmatimonadota bacterium]|nr:hypothetical protein [Gemmatimonadota bacterium]